MEEKTNLADIIKRIQRRGMAEKSRSIKEYFNKKKAKNKNREIKKNMSNERN